jgi:hypothetical protein
LPNNAGSTRSGRIPLVTFLCHAQTGNRAMADLLTAPLSGVPELGLLGSEELDI